MAECAVDGCSDEVKSRGYCVRHYRKWQRHGDPLHGKSISKSRRLPRSAPIDERFWIKVDVRGPNECWLWLGGITVHGYGVFRGTEVREVFGTELAHRIAWLLDGRDLDSDLTLDHLCFTRLCVNAQHIEQVTQAINTIRADGFAAANKAKTHCPSRHPYSADNTYVPPNGGARVCRECVRERQRAYHARKRAAVK